MLTLNDIDYILFGGGKSVIALDLPTPHDAQNLILESDARFKVVCCGRRFGKTELAIIEICNGVNIGERWSYFAPTYKMLGDVWRVLKAVLQPVIKYKNETEKRIELVTGGIVECWSMDAAESVRGRKYHGVIIDEAAMIANLMSTWNETITPLLTDYQGRALFLSTPKGHNDFWRLWSRGIDELFQDWQAWLYPTSANPYILQSEIDLQEQSLPQRSFEQEYLAAFVDDAGGVFRGVRDVSTLQEHAPYKGEFVFGVDWAKSHDFTVISIIDVNTRQQVHIERFNQISWHLQRERLIHLYEQWQPFAIVAESNSIGEPNIEELLRYDLPVQPFQTTAQTKTPLIDSLALAIEKQEITLLDNSIQVMELQAYQMERLPSGRFRYNSPDGGHDDTVIALALAWYAAHYSRRSILLMDY